MRKLAIVGLGLIGGSIARTAKKLQLAERVVGYSKSAKDMRLASEAGVLDDTADSAAEAAAGADLAVLAAPPGALFALAEEISAADAQVVVTDTGSVKQPLAQALSGLPPDRSGRIVPGHPIAGTEHSGFAAAGDDLFDGCIVVLTPTADTAAAAAEKVRRFWHSCGAQTVRMEAAEHDAHFARSSHLPHLLAWTLTAAVADDPHGQELLRYSAGGLRDFTRIAASDPELWSEIVQLNRHNLVSAMRHFSQLWQRMSELVESGDAQQLRQFMAQTRAKAGAGRAEPAPALRR